MICAKCGKNLEDGGYIVLDNWLQWHYYCERNEFAYCSKECFADDWMVEWFDAEELEEMRDADGA